MIGDIQHREGALQAMAIGTPHPGTFITSQSVHPTPKHRLQPQEDGSFHILSVADNSLLGHIHPGKEQAPAVTLIEGKGGFTAVVTPRPDLKLFILPGGSVQMGHFSLALQGQALTSNPNKPQAMHRPSPNPPQQYTHQAMILGAGLATRFEPVSGENTHYAKPSTPLVGNQSVIRCIVEALKHHGFTNLFINTYFMAPSLKGGLADVSGLTIHYLDETAPSGTAGGLRKLLEGTSPEAQEALKHFQPTTPILIVQGDAVTDTDFSALLKAHESQQAALTIGCQQVRDEEVHQFGIIQTDRSASDGVSGNITGFMEKPPLAEAGDNRLASTGFYVISPQTYPAVLAAYQACLAAGKDGTLDFAQDVFPEVIRQVASGKIKNSETGKSMGLYAQQVDGYWSDIGNPTQYLETLHDIYAGKVNIPLPKPTETYFDQGVAYWPRAKQKALQEGIILKGNVIAGCPFS